MHKASGSDTVTNSKNKNQPDQHYVSIPHALNPTAHHEMGQMLPVRAVGDSRVLWGFSFIFLSFPRDVIHYSWNASICLWGGKKRLYLYFPGMSLGKEMSVASLS